jgi:hypothetical protein
VTVTSTGTTPNYIHTVVFSGVAGNPAILAVANNLTSIGSFAFATTVSGPAVGFKGRSLQLLGGTADITEIYQQVTLTPLAVYALGVWAAVEATISSGTITISLVNSIGSSTPLVDENGASATLTTNLSTLTTTPQCLAVAFATPRILPATVYVKIKISAALASGKILYLDECCLAKMTSLYAGGPRVAIFNGRLPCYAGTATELPTEFTLTVANNRAGELHEWMERNFDLRGKGLYMPVATSGSETIADSLMS